MYDVIMCLLEIERMKYLSASALPSLQSNSTRYIHCSPQGFKLPFQPITEKSWYYGTVNGTVEGKRIPFLMEIVVVFLTISGAVTSYY